MQYVNRLLFQPF
ncbi:Protein of unknown function [Bacillus toyonensis]|nr:Protein of unknown function [Bacillus toyonensis]